MRKPCTLSFEEAATVPTVYITAFTAFGQNLAPGSRVLIHAGTGCVGLAAARVAHALGYQTVSTAGSADKRCHLRRQGLVAAADSRSTSFASTLLAAAGPVDVVLNSLTSPGEFAVLHCLGCQVMLDLMTPAGIQFVR